MSNDRANFPVSKVVDFYNPECVKEILCYGAKMGILSGPFGVTLEDLKDEHKVDLLYQGWKHSKGIGV
jgi:hypothetical protein